MNLFSFILLIGIVFLGVRWFRLQPAHKKTETMIKTILVSILLVVVWLSLTGRIHLLSLGLALFLPFIQRNLPSLLRWLPWAVNQFKNKASGQSPSTAHVSKVKTSMLEMTLNHDTGHIDGLVLAGHLAGRKLSEFSEAEFLSLLKECRASDTDSVRLLETYLDKRFGDSWRADDVSADDSASSSSSSSQMSLQEAFDILGVSTNATRDEIIQAHRRMIQKMHPDRGGSAWIAARINDAKKLLLAHIT